MEAQPGVKMASADQEKQIRLPSDQSLEREKAGSPGVRNGPDSLPAPESSQAQDFPDRDSVGRDDDTSQTCEVPGNEKSRKDTGAWKPSHPPPAARRGDVVDPALPEHHLNRRAECAEVSESMTALQPFLG